MIFDEINNRYTSKLGNKMQNIKGIKHNLKVLLIVIFLALIIFAGTIIVIYVMSYFEEYRFFPTTNSITSSDATWDGLIRINRNAILKSVNFNDGVTNFECNTELILNIGKNFVKLIFENSNGSISNVILGTYDMTFRYIFDGSDSLSIATIPVEWK